MTTVFLSGSRSISRTNDVIRKYLDNLISRRLYVILGDANGADRAMQSYFAEAGYNDVTIYCAGTRCRNNVGGWATKKVEVKPNIKGREFYEQKDREMARQADSGFVLWDGKSFGSITNVFELLKSDKNVVLYFGPEKEFYELSTIDDLNLILTRCAPKTLEMISKKNRLPPSLSKNRESTQISLALS